MIHEDANENLVTPSAESLAFFVRMQRGLLRWKQQTLAAMANVSLSTIERVERGDTVAVESLNKIAIALGFPDEYLTATRRKLTEAEALESIHESLAWMDGRLEVPVAPLTKERQIRDLATADMLVMDSDLGEIVEDDLFELREWFELVGFMRCTQTGLIGPKPDRGFRMRELYGSLLAHLAQIQTSHRAVCLVGTYTANTDYPIVPTATVAVIALRSTIKNPACAKINVLWCEQKFSWQDAMEQIP